MANVGKMYCMKFPVGLPVLLGTVFNLILFDRRTILDLNSGTAVLLAYLSQNYSTSFGPPKKSIFGIHDPCGIKILFQLRVCLSPLKGHKKNHCFFDTPSAICDCGGGKEDTIHFFTECALFATTMANLLSSISNILIHKNLEHMLNSLSYMFMVTPLSVRL